VTQLKNTLTFHFVLESLERSEQKQTKNAFTTVQLTLKIPLFKKEQSLASLLEEIILFNKSVDPVHKNYHFFLSSTHQVNE